MYRIPLFSIAFGLSLGLFAQQSPLETPTPGDTSRVTERSIRENVISEIDQNRVKERDSLRQRMIQLEQEISRLDVSLKEGGDLKQQTETLNRRLQVIEQKQTAVAQDELSVYQANYKTAVMNLIWMERELRPLHLFNASRDFYGSLGNVSNPMSYGEFKEWYTTFRAYINSRRASETTAKLVGSVLDLAQDFAKGASPLTSTVTTALFQGGTMFIQQIDKKDKAMREKSERMLELAMVLSQFTEDKDLIETEWDAINAELAELQKLYNETLAANLKILNVDPNAFNQRFANESNAERLVTYVNELRGVIDTRVEAERKSNVQDWRETFYYQMSTVQSLKVRFGTLTFRINENLKKYDDLLKKYKDNPLIGTQVSALTGKLSVMQEAFNRGFNPMEYVNSANRMYKVN